MTRLDLRLLLTFCFFVFAGKINQTNGGNNVDEITIPTPLTDFGRATYRGFQGGLYPNGSNQRPAAHNAAGVAIAQNIKPLNSTGAIDEIKGTIVWLSIGMSNATQETQAFLSLLQTFPDKNPKLTFVDGAAGGEDINRLNHSAAPYWRAVYNRLTKENLSPAQVQVIWFKEAEKRPADTAFATYPDALKMKYKSVMQILKSKFPNVKLCYLSSRIYAGYARIKQNPEPFAWYNGWTVKRLIEVENPLKLTT